MPSVLETPRLILRHFTTADADALARIHADPLVAEFIGGIQTLDQTRQRIEEFVEDYRRWGFSKWAVILKSNGELIGRCGPVIEIVEGAEEIELGYTLARNQWGKGYATEAASATLAICRSNWQHTRLISLVNPANARSAKVADRIGMRFERNVRWQEKIVQLFATQH